MYGCACNILRRGWLLFLLPLWWGVGCWERPVTPEADQQGIVQASPLLLDSASRQILLEPIPPQLPVMLVSGITMPAQNKLTYQWEVAETAQIFTGDSLVLHFMDVGSFTMRLLIEDAVGNKLEDSLIVRVIPPPPLATDSMHITPGRGAQISPDPPQGVLFQWSIQPSLWKWNLIVIDTAQKDTLRYFALEGFRMRLPKNLRERANYLWFVEAVDPWGGIRRGPTMNFSTLPQGSITGLVRGRVFPIAPETSPLAYDIAVFLPVGDTLLFKPDSLGNFSFLYFHSDTVRMQLQGPAASSDTLVFPRSLPYFPLDLQLGAQP